MRNVQNPQLQFGQVDISKIQFNSKSRDDIPQILKGLQYIYIYSLTETCKFHHIEPYDWFRYVLQTIPSCQTLEEFEALLPFNIDKNLLATTLSCDIS